MILGNVDRILILGESGSGKTFLAEILARQYSRILVVTPAFEDWQKIPKENIVYTLSSEACYKQMKKSLEVRNVLLVVDDADIYLNPYILDDEYIRTIIISGRHYGIAWMMVSRRTQDMPKLILKQANKVMCFQTDIARDLQIIKENYGEQASLYVKNLNREKHEFLFIDREARTLEVLIA